ncbi:uncharacterized protein LOC112051200 isoform X2 [Bicyclus anynana]|uniref:Uncharacterized protein LOC112051200 isoform X2 n=1 Tax=Bicyclus anynana TaxID=110368 RepID=A0ABM3LUI2_BICAN|nr:uncharacterized protein LOC112051200 isoform X2 [Bicyclus anynana]
MVIIAIGHFNAPIKLRQLVQQLAPTIQEQFQALNFKNARRGKLVYLKLIGKNPKVDEVLKRLNKKVFRKIKLHAFIPDELPPITVAAKPIGIPTKLRRICNIAPNFSDNKFRQVSMDCLLAELQTKFTGLCALSDSTGHKLLDNMAQTIYDRICEIHEASPVNSCFKLTSFYRRRYPHYTDFQFIQSTLHDIQDAQGTPRLDIDENELCAVNTEELLNLTYENTHQACNLHINWVSNLLNLYVRSLKVTDGASSPEIAAKMTVRKNLKKMAPHISSVYGEPYLPNKTAMLPFLQQFGTVSSTRSEHMYNHVTLKVSWMSYLQLLKSDGQNIDNAKLVIRPDNMPMYQIKRVMKHSSLRQSGVEEVDDEEVADDAEHSDEETEDTEWSEDW